jgi:porphobilinogen deaminase
MLAASVAGAWLGAGVVAGLPRRKIQLGMGVAVSAERAFLGALGGGCNGPLGAYADGDGAGGLWLGALVARSARAAGLDVRAVAAPSTAEGLVAAVARLYA